MSHRRASAVNRRKERLSTVRTSYGRCKASVLICTSNHSSSTWPNTGALSASQQLFKLLYLMSFISFLISTSESTNMENLLIVLTYPLLASPLTLTFLPNPTFLPPLSLTLYLSLLILFPLIHTTHTHPHILTIFDIYFFFS